MSVQVTGDLLAVHVMVLVILDIGSLTYVCYLVFIIDIRNQRQPSFCGGGSIGFLIEPTAGFAADENQSGCEKHLRFQVRGF